MKAEELISLLQGYIAEHGDLEAAQAWEYDGLYGQYLLGASQVRVTPRLFWDYDRRKWTKDHSQLVVGIGDHE